MKLKFTIGALALALLTATSANTLASSSSHFEKVDIVSEGIDLVPIVVRANAAGYNGYEKEIHTYSVRLFAKAKGARNVFAAGIGNKPGMSHIEVTAGKWLFRHVTPEGDDGWGVYKKSIKFNAKATEIEWYKSPIQACKDNITIQKAKGMPQAAVLDREWNVQANAKIRFYAGAANKIHIKNRQFQQSGQTLQENISYPVNVKCREAL